MPKILLRAISFRRCCETAPLLIQDDELIVGAPNGAPRAGAFSPDIAWRWMEQELDTIGTRPQDPFYISDEDKRIMREEIFPFWKGKSVDEYCEAQYREAGLWELSAEAFVTDCSYHALNGGGDSNPGYDVILMKKGMLDIQREAREHLERLDYGNPDHLEKIYFYKSVIETTEGVMTYARRLSQYAAELAQRETNPKRRAELLIPRAVASVAEQRQTARGELHADLVRAPGVQPDAHERECVRAPELLIGQARLAHALAHAADDIALVALCVTEEEIRQRVRGQLRVPGQDGEVLLFHLPLGDKAGELSRDGRAARVDHHAADLAVEPVDGEDLLALPERAVVLAQ